MRKNLGSMPAVFPMPVLMIATYDENGTVDVMNAAWGSICDYDKIAIFISEGHKTSKNIHKMKAFTVSLADKEHMSVADYFGLASGNKIPDKFERTGFHAVKSSFVNAPVITEFPLAMECELSQIIKTDSFHAVIGKIINVSVDEKILSENGKVDPIKLNALVFDQFQNGYYTATEKAGQAFKEGQELLKKQA